MEHQVSLFPEKCWFLFLKTTSFFCLLVNFPFWRAGSAFCWSFSSLVWKDFCCWNLAAKMCASETVAKFERLDTHTHTTHNVDSKSERLSSVLLSFCFEQLRGQTTRKHQHGFDAIRLWFRLVQVYSSKWFVKWCSSIEVTWHNIKVLFEFAKWRDLKVSKNALSFPDKNKNTAFETKVHTRVKVGKGTLHRRKFNMKPIRKKWL